MIPNKLQQGDTIGIVAPSKPFNQEKKFELDNFIAYMNKQNIKVELSNNFYAKDKYNVGAGTLNERANDINSMFADKNIKAIWCLQGGEPANQILDLMDYDVVKKNPKLFLGKSDIDVLLLALNKKTDLITIHCCDPKIGSHKELDFDYTKKWLKKRLFEGCKEVKPSEKWICINKGFSEGKILGCNITSILKLAGTDYFPDFTDSILFIETFKSNAAAIIWKFTQLKQLGVFNKIKGIVIGNNFGFENENFKVEEIVKDLTLEYNFPILKINEFGHYQPHAFLPIGAKIKLNATNKTIGIVDDFLV
ncbi:MAG: LD-carboxypeptidase [Patescibacteria group bacterium]|nr:LD-carboxypeptidase [Patescibacteria group bacterium]